MRSIDVEELKKIQLDMLDAIAVHCEKEKIRYFLACGTLLGAIRHNGYIPWDDDIDIAMPRPDYDRFISTFNSVDSPYRMMCYELNNSYDLPFGKVTDTRTIMVETLYKGSNTYGIFIDVFPLDGCPDMAIVKKARNYHLMLNAKKARLGAKRTLKKKLVIALGKIYLSFTSVSQLTKRIIQLSRTAEYGSSNKVGSISSIDKLGKNIYPIEWFEKTIKHQFEGKEYDIPIGYDQYLTRLYGNYMQIPPADKRISTHVFEAWWKE